MVMNLPKVGVGVIIVKDNKVLFQKRIGAHGEGTWSFPGGHLEFNETFEECAKRETKEEFDVELKNVRFATLTNDFFLKEDKHYITIFMIGEIASGEVKIMEPDKTKEFSWFAWEDAPSPLFEPIVNLLKQGYSPFSNKFQHYKGNKYELIYSGVHSDTLEEYVVYRGLYDSEEFGKNPLWVKPKETFFENVELNGEKVPRFKRL